MMRRPSGRRGLIIFGRVHFLQWMSHCENIGRLQDYHMCRTLGLAGITHVSTLCFFLNNLAHECHTKAGQISLSRLIQRHRMTLQMTQLWWCSTCRSRSAKKPWLRAKMGPSLLWTTSSWSEILVSDSSPARNPCLGGGGGVSTSWHCHFLARRVLKTFRRIHLRGLELSLKRPVKIP